MKYIIKVAFTCFITPTGLNSMMGQIFKPSSDNLPRKKHRPMFLLCPQSSLQNPGSIRTVITVPRYGLAFHSSSPVIWPLLEYPILQMRTVKDVA